MRTLTTPRANAVFLLFLLALMSWCPPFLAAAAEPPVARFGVCLSLTGPYAASGKKYLAGIKMRMEHHNDNLKPADPKAFKLEMVLRDDKSTADGAAAVTRELAEKADVSAIIGPLSTNQMLAMQPIARDKQVPIISPSVTSPKIGRDRDWTYRLLFDDNYQGVALARYLVNQEKVKTTAAIISDAAIYSSSVFAAFKKEFEKLGGKVVAEEHYKWVVDDDDRHYDFQPHLTRIADAKPDIVLLPVNSVDVIAIVSRSTQLEMGLRFCGGDTWQHENILLSSGNDLEGACFVSAIDFNLDSADMHLYLQLFDHSNDPDAQLMSVLGYDALSLIIEALRHGRSGSEIHDRLYQIRDFPLATGTLTIDPEQGSQKTAYIQKITMDHGEFRARIVAEVEP